MHLRLYKRYQIIKIQFRKLGQQFVGPFKIIEKIKRLICYFRFSFIIKIHNIVLIMYLKPTIISISNLYNRHFIIPLFIIIDNEKEYEIERLIKK